MTFARVYSATAAILFGVSAVLVQAQPAPETLQAYEKSEAAYKASPRDEKAAWEFGRASFDVAEATKEKAQRAKIAEKGIAACRMALQQSSNSVAAHYYLGLNLGELASTRGLSALKIIKEVEAEWLIAARLDEKFDFAGPARSLGILYRDAPSFGSIGSRSKARHQLMRSVELAPHYPENRLALIESYLNWGDATTARAELKALEDVWADSRKELSGVEWDKQWKSWETELQKLKKRVGEATKIETPREKGSS